MNPTPASKQGIEMKKESNPMPSDGVTRPPPPPPPPKRLFKETMFGGFIETKESKRRTQEYKEGKERK